MSRHIAYQLFRSANSVGANRAETKLACSRREFALKNSVALKECLEVVFWLRLAEAKVLRESFKARAAHEGVGRTDGSARNRAKSL